MGFLFQLYLFVASVTLVSQVSSLSLIVLINKMKLKSNPLLPACQGDCEDLKEKEQDCTLETKQHEG